MELTEEQDLEKLLLNLENVSKQFLDSSHRIMLAGNSKLFALDFLALSVNNRAISLTNAFITLAKANNFLAAVTLIRIQLDNALRFFASTLVKDSHDFASHFIDGHAIKDYKDINGINLRDNYLVEKLEVYFKGTQKLYNDACGYIHLSDRHFWPTLSKGRNDNQSIEIQMCSSDNFNIEEKIDFTVIMIEVTRLVLVIVEQWIHEKIRLSEIHNKKKKE